MLKEKSSEVIGVTLVAVTLDQNGEIEDYVPLSDVSDDQKDTLDEELILYDLMEIINRAKAKLKTTAPIHRAIARAASFIY